MDGVDLNITIVHRDNVHVIANWSFVQLFKQMCSFVGESLFHSCDFVPFVRTICVCLCSRAV